MKVDIVLCYEIWQRELQALTALRCELEKRGYKVKMLHRNPRVDRYFEAYLYSPKVVYFPWVYSESDLEKARDFKGNCNKILNAQCEQILGKRAEQTGFFKVKGEARKVYHVCWGEKSYQRFIDCGIKEDHILKVGNINLEINKKKYDKFYLSKEQIAKQFSLDRNKKWMLFCSNFKFVKSHYADLIGLEKRSPGIISLAQESKKARELILQWFTQYLSEHNDIEIIYRPHPMEKYDRELEKLQKNISSFHYISDYSINQWSRVVDLFTTWGSTSIMDAIYINRKSAYIMPERMPEIIRGDADNVCPHIYKYEDFSDFLNGNTDTAKLSLDGLIYKNIDSINTLANYIELIYKSKVDFKLDSKLTKYKKWIKLGVLDQFNLFMYWIAKSIKIYKLYKTKSTYYNLYFEAYESKKMEKNIYYKMRKITNV